MTRRPENGQQAKRRAGRLSIVLALALGGCASLGDRLEGHVEAPTSTWLSGNDPVRAPSRAALRLRFTRAINSEVEGADVPTERAGVALDPASDRIYVGTSRGVLYALDSRGRRHERYDTGAAIDATPVHDPDARILYVACGDGTIHALRTPTLERIWKESVAHPLAQVPVLTRDVLYVVSEDDVVSAVARSDGEVLWTYRRPPAEEITIAGHAGLLLAEGRVITAFNDGVVVGLDAADGAVVWEVDTSVDVEESASGLPKFRDVDTTPVRIGARIYVASFAGGLYAMELRNGSILYRDREATGIVSILAIGDKLVLSSADDGVSLFDPRERTTLWRRGVDRGAPSPATLIGDDVIVFGESAGSLIAARVEDGRELTRFESGYGFTAAPSIADPIVAIVSNTGNLFVLDVAQRRAARAR